MLFSLQNDQKILFHTINSVALPAYLTLFKMPPDMGCTLFISTLFINVSEIYKIRDSRKSCKYVFSWKGSRIFNRDISHPPSAGLASKFVHGTKHHFIEKRELVPKMALFFTIWGHLLTMDTQIEFSLELLRRTVLSKPSECKNPQEKRLDLDLN